MSAKPLDDMKYLTIRTTSGKITVALYSEKSFNLAALTALDYYGPIYAESEATALEEARHIL